MLAGTKSITEFYQLIEIIINNQNSFLQCFIKLYQGQDIIDAMKILDNINVDDIELLLPKEVRRFLQKDKLLSEQQKRLQEEINVTDKNIAYELARKAVKNSKTIIQNIEREDGFLSKVDNWIDVVLTSGAQMIDQGARILSADEHLDIVDAAVAQIGDREINDPVPSEQWNRSCRAEILQAVDSDTSWS